MAKDSFWWVEDGFTCWQEGTILIAEFMDHLMIDDLSLHVQLPLWWVFVW